MATYEYRCEQCQRVFEVRRSWSDVVTAIVCPHCASAQVRRIYTPVMMFTRGDGGAVQSLGARGCAGCAASSCSGCGSAKN
jgi:putative FmdB family regulatory protein